MRKSLVKREDQGKYFWELRSCAYWQEFEQPKVLYPDIYEHQSFAWDVAGFFSVNTTYFIPTPEQWLAALLNSTSIEWFYTQVSNKVRGGYLRAFSDYIKQIPIPAATPDQQRLCERLAEALIFLHGPAAKKAKGAPSDPMTAHLEQWLNGLVYELFFAGELHARRLRLFDETAKLNPPELAKVSEGQKLARVQELCDASRPRLGAMLAELKKLDAVRAIEEAAGVGATG